MRQRLVVQNRQLIGNTDAVIGAQRSASGSDLVAVDIEIKPVVFKVMGHARLLGPDHIHVGLQYQRFLALIAGTGLFAHHHVVGSVLAAGESPLPGKLHNIGGELLLLQRTVGDSGYFLKPVHDSLRLQCIQSTHLYGFLSLLMGGGAKKGPADHDAYDRPGLILPRGKSGYFMMTWLCRPQATK